MKTVKRFGKGAGPLRNVFVWAVLLLLSAVGTTQAATSKTPQITAKLHVASKTTSAHVLKHKLTFQLVGMDNVVHKPLSVVPTTGGHIATFRLPNKPGKHPFSEIAPNFYRVFAYDRGYLTGVGAIMVSYDPKGAGRTWTFPVDTRQGLLLGTEVLKRAATLSGASDTVLYSRLARAWRMTISEAKPGPDYRRVAVKAGKYTLMHPVKSPTKAAKAILALLGTAGVETAGAGGAAAVPEDAAMDAKIAEKIETAASADVITTCGNFAAAVVGEIPFVGPFLSAGVSSLFDALAGQQTVSTTQFDQFVGQAEYQIGQLQQDMATGKQDFKQFVQQTDFNTTQSQYSKVFKIVTTIQKDYNTYYIGTICSASGVQCVPANNTSGNNGPLVVPNWNTVQHALATNSTMRHTLESRLTTTLSDISDLLPYFVPRVANTPVAQNDLFILNNDLRQDMHDYTELNDSFSSILTDFAKFDEFYESVGLGVALMFDQAAQMLAMAQYLYDNYSTVDSFSPAMLPLKNQPWVRYCQQNYSATAGNSTSQYLPYCMAEEFKYSNAQQWLLMSPLNLTGGCPPAWQSNSLYISAGTAYTTGCPWVVLPAKSSVTAGFPWLNGGGGGSCVVNDWNAAGSFFYVTCNNNSGVPTYSTFQYNGCGKDTYGLWGGYLFCDNTIGSTTTGHFQWSNNIRTKSSDSVSIDVGLGSQGEGVYLWSCNGWSYTPGNQCGMSQGTVISGANGDYTTSLTLNPTGNDYNNFIALIKDTSNGGYVFNLIYNNDNTVSLACPSSNFGGYTAVYTGPTPPSATDLINQNNYKTSLCQPGTPPSWSLCSTNPKNKYNQGYCSAILMNNQVWYGLFQPVTLSATDDWAESAILEYGN